jgi:hypothetical protein
MEIYLGTSENLVMRSDPVITYNHMEDDEVERQKRAVSKVHPASTFEIMAFVAEEMVILMMLGVLFFLW